MRRNVEKQKLRIEIKLTKIVKMIIRIKNLIFRLATFCTYMSPTPCSDKIKNISDDNFEIHRKVRIAKVTCNVMEMRQNLSRKFYYLRSNWIFKPN